jgi:cold shock CspA family protein
MNTPLNHNTRAPQPEGRVVRLAPEKGQGFVRTRDGREIPFQRNGVLEPGFDRLRIGASVRFIESVGEQGSRASSVQVVDQA